MINITQSLKRKDFKKSEISLYPNFKNGTIHNNHLSDLNYKIYNLKREFFKFIKTDFKFN